MKLYTKKGDDGSTGLYGGGRVSKNDIRVSAYGDVDELNAVLGWCTLALPPDFVEFVRRIQHQLFSLGAELATPTGATPADTLVLMSPDDVARLEEWIDRSSAATPAIRTFILPSGSEAGTRLHVARAVCRRAERSIVTLAHREHLRPLVLVYMNRLSDLLFAWARQVNHQQNQPEIAWNPAQPSQ